MFSLAEAPVPSPPPFTPTCVRRNVSVKLTPTQSPLAAQSRSVQKKDTDKKTRVLNLGPSGGDTSDEQDPRGLEGPRMPSQPSVDNNGPPFPPDFFFT